jgi:hypothetical protein
MVGVLHRKLPLLQEIAKKDLSDLEKAVSTFLNNSLRPSTPCITRAKQIIKILEPTVLQKN